MLHGLTTPEMLTATATNLESVNLSLPLLGKSAARARVKKLEVEDNTVTRLASVCASDIWNV